MKRTLKILVFSCVGLVLLVTALSLFVLKDSISTTNGSCKILFADLNSGDAQVQSQAHRFVESAVRRVKSLGKNDPIHQTLYSQAVSDLSHFCDEHPTDNLLQLQMAYLGIDK